MFYYIIDNKIIGYETQLDPVLYQGYPMLTNPQSDFYEANPTATLDEVLVLTLRPVAPAMTLEEYKAMRINQYSDISFEKRRAFYDDYKLINAALGTIYNAETNTDIINCVKAFRDEFYRLQTEINNARSIEEIDSITDNFDNLTW